MYVDMIIYSYNAKQQNPYIPSLPPEGEWLSRKMKERNMKPTVWMREDEAIFQFSNHNKKIWIINGITTLCSKSLGVGCMVAAHTSCTFGFGFHISNKELKQINDICRGTKYKSYASKAAIFLNGTDDKPDLK